MLTAAILSKKNKKVLVLEQSDTVGGCTDNYWEKGYDFDIGLDYVGSSIARGSFNFDLMRT